MTSKQRESVEVSPHGPFRLEEDVSVGGTSYMVRVTTEHLDQPIDPDVTKSGFIHGRPGDMWRCYFQTHLREVPTSGSVILPRTVAFYLDKSEATMGHGEVVRSLASGRASLTPASFHLDLPRTAGVARREDL